jgi:hypothetical protein
LESEIEPAFSKENAMTRRNKNNVARTASRCNSFGAGLENLETRQMFSASPASFYTVGTQLVCQLNSPSEQMSVVRSSNGIQFNIEGVVEDVAGSFSYLSVIAKSGNNSVVIGDNMIIPTCVWAGTGNDTLSTGASNDSLRAGAGDDTLIALGGNDNKLFAGTGYTNIWETYSATTDNYYYTSTGTLATHFFSSFLNTSDITLDGRTIAEPGLTNTSIPFSGDYENFSNCPLFGSNGPQISDVQQQHLGDCYFMSALGAISNVDPQQIRNNITALGDGTYAMEFYENGKPVFVRVDGYLPVEDNQLFGANFGNGNCIWAPLMEKGFAYFDSLEQGKSPDYGVIDKGGFADPAFDILTGNTAQGTFNVTTGTGNLSMFGGNANTFAGWINWELQKGDAVEMGFSNGDSNDDYSIPGVLENDHMYTVVSDTLNNSGQITGFWVRNPWGFDLQSSQGTEVMAKNGHNDGSDDGMVWVSVAQAWSVLDDIGAVAV